jgi:hypothetical protein
MKDPEDMVGMIIDLGLKLALVGIIITAIGITLLYFNLI